MVQDFGTETTDGLTGIKAKVVFLFDNYGEKTSSRYSTFWELKYAVERDMPIIPLKLCRDHSCVRDMADTLARFEFLSVDPDGFRLAVIREPHSRR